MLKTCLFVLTAVALAAVPAAAQGTDAWDNTVNPNNNINVTSGAALAGTSFGLEATATGTTTAFVEDRTPANEARYRARFYFDPNTLDPGIAMGRFRTRVFTAIDADGSPSVPGNRRMIMVALRKQSVSAPYSILLRVYRGPGYVSPIDGGPYEQVGPFNFDNGAPDHWIEFDWMKASTPGGTNGTFTVWLDNNSTPVATLTGIGIDEFGIDTARLGLIQPLDGANGAVNLDEFESRRQTQIGPLS